MRQPRQILGWGSANARQHVRRATTRRPSAPGWKSTGPGSTSPARDSAWQTPDDPLRAA